MPRPLRFAVAFWSAAFAASAVRGQELKVVATTQDLAWFASQIGGAVVSAEALARGDQDVHRVVAKPVHLLKLKRADLLIQIGLDLEHAWIPALRESSPNDRIKPGGLGFVNAAEGVVPLEVPSALDRAQGVGFFVSAEPSVARAAGVRVGRETLLLYGALGGVVAAAVPVAGPLIVFGLLVGPPFLLREGSADLSAYLRRTSAAGVVGAYLGAVASVMADRPLGASAAAAVLVVSSAFAVLFRTKG